MLDRQLVAPDRLVEVGVVDKLEEVNMMVLEVNMMVLDVGMSSWEVEEHMELFRHMKSMKVEVEEERIYLYEKFAIVREYTFQNDQ